MRKTTGLSGKAFLAAALWISLMALVSWQIGGWDLAGTPSMLVLFWFVGIGGGMMEIETKDHHLLAERPMEQFVWLFFPAFFSLLLIVFICFPFVRMAEGLRWAWNALRKTRKSPQAAA